MAALFIAVWPVDAAGRQSAADPELERHLKALRAEFLQAQESADKLVLDRVLADGFSYSTATGRVETRGEFIVRLTTGPNRPQAGDDEFLEDQIRVYGGHTVVWLTHSVRRGGMAGDLHVRSTDVLVKSSTGHWQWVSVHSTRIAIAP